MDDNVRAVLRDIGDMIKGCIPQGTCFVLFLQSSEGTHYLSNGDRDDVLRALEEWVQKTSGALTPKEPETSARIDARLELERTCATIGKAFAEVSKLILLLFTFGVEGSAAYFTNVPDAHGKLAEWIKKQRGIS
jgi:hypothetical protein